MMTDKAWKAFERVVCRWFGGQRRGADFRGAEGGKNDCTGTEGFSVEVKHLSRPTFGQMQDAVKQAQSAACMDEIPLAVVAKKGQKHKDALIVMSVDDFLDWFVTDDRDGV